MAPGFEDATTLSKSKASEEYWAKSAAEKAKNAA
jgi:hypothetical protein